MNITSFRTPGLGDQTYLFEHDGVGILVDPQRDINRFLDVAAEKDVELRWVLETHLHNDYLSGGEQAAKRSGAELIMPAAAAQAYRGTPAFHLEDLPAHGGMTIRPIHTPGHTPEHTSYLVLIDGEPVAVFSGGSLLVGSAGRPDLLGPERADTLARLQYISIHRLAELPGNVELLPTHGEGSFCTASGAGKYTSTIKEEVATNPLLQLPDPDALSAAMLEAPMPIPFFYRFMGPGNTFGVKPMPAPGPARMTVGEALGSGAHLVDMRPREKQAEGMLAGSLTNELDDSFGSWVGWLVPYNEPVVLVAEPDQDLGEAVTQLAQIGVDNVIGAVTDLTGAPLEKELSLVEPAAARKMLDEDPDTQLFDVRMPSEYAAGEYPGAIQRFVGDVFTQGVPMGLDSSKPVLVACGAGRRAVIVASHLAELGFDVKAVSPGGVPEIVAASS